MVINFNNKKIIYLTHEEVDIFFRSVGEYETCDIIFDNKKYRLFKYPHTNTYTFCDHIDGEKDLVDPFGVGEGVIFLKSGIYKIDENDRDILEIFYTEGTKVLETYFELRELS